MDKNGITYAHRGSEREREGDKETKIDDDDDNHYNNEIDLMVVAFDFPLLHI